MSLLSEHRPQGRGQEGRAGGGAGTHIVVHVLEQRRVAHLGHLVLVLLVVALQELLQGSAVLAAIEAGDAAGTRTPTPPTGLTTHEHRSHPGRPAEDQGLGVGGAGLRLLSLNITHEKTPYSDLPETYT